MSTHRVATGVVAWALIVLAACATRPDTEAPDRAAAQDAPGDATKVSSRPTDATLSQLLRAIETTDLREATRLLDVRPQLARMCTPTGESPLVAVARLGRDELIAPLLERGAPIRPNTVAPSDGALCEAIRRGRVSTVRQLLGASKATAPSTDGLLCLAARLGHADIVRALLDHGVSASENHGGTTPLHQAVEGAIDAACRRARPGLAHGTDHAEIVGLLLARGANTQVTYAVGATPLELALGGVAIPGIVRQLRQAEAHPHLHADAWLGELDLVRAHADAHPRQIDATDGLGHTPLAAAVLGRQPAMVDLLLARGASAAIGNRSHSRPLAHAAWMGEVELAKRLVLAKAPIDASDDEGCTALATAAEHGQLAVVELLLEAGADPNSVAKDGRTPLHFAARSGNAAVVRRLLDAGARAGARTGEALDGLTPLHYAAGEGWIDTVRMLLDASVDPNVATLVQRNTPLFYAAGGRDFRRFLRRQLTGQDPDATDSAAVLRHHPALWVGEPARGPAEHYRRIVELLLERGAQPVANHEGLTPLHLACRFNQHDVAKTLLARGSDATARARTGNTALHYLGSAMGQAGPEADRELVRLLVQRGASLEARGETAMTPLHGACQAARPAIATILIELGADLAACDAAKATPLHHAAAFGRSDLVELLVKAGADREALDMAGQTPLAAAICNVRPETALRLLEVGSVPAVTCGNGGSAIHAAALVGLSDVVRALLDRGVDPNTPAESSNTPLVCAAGGPRCSTPEAMWPLLQAQCPGRNLLNDHTREERAEVARILLERGAKIEHRKRTSASQNPGIVDNLTALSRAADWGELEVLQVLLARGANVDARDHYDATALHMAAQTPFAPDDRLAACAAALLAKGANPDARMQGGETPLHRAAEIGHAAVTKVLLEHHANTSARDDQGNLPINVARRHGRRAVIALLDGAK